MNHSEMPSTSKQEEFQESMWICSYCTFAENPITEGKCTVCQNYKAIRSERSKTLTHPAWEDFAPERRSAFSRCDKRRKFGKKPSPVKRAKKRAETPSSPIELQVARPKPRKAAVIPARVPLTSRRPAGKKPARTLPSEVQKELSAQSDTDEFEAEEKLEVFRGTKKRPRSCEVLSSLEGASSSPVRRSRSSYSRGKKDLYSMDRDDDATEPVKFCRKRLARKKNDKVVSFGETAVDRFQNKGHSDNESPEIPLPITSVFSLRKRLVQEGFPTVTEGITWTSLSSQNQNKKSPVKAAMKRPRLAGESISIKSLVGQRASTRSRRRELDPAVQVMKYATEDYWKNFPTETTDDSVCRQNKVCSSAPLPERKRRLRNDEPMSEEIRSLRQKRPHKGILKNSSAYDDGFKAPYPISAFPPRLQAYKKGIHSPRLAAREVLELVHNEQLNNSAESSSQEWSSDEVVKRSVTRKKRIRFSLEARPSKQILTDGNMVRGELLSRRKRTSHGPALSLRRRKRLENVAPVAAFQERNLLYNGKRTITADLLPKQEKIHMFESFDVTHNGVTMKFEEMVFSDCGFSESDEEL